MAWLNYHHLLYFWTVAREGSIARATKKLHLTQPTISAQVRALEESLGEQLFARGGRRLVLTEMGQVVYRYAEEIFTPRPGAAGRAGRGIPTGRPSRLMAGVADEIPKLRGPPAARAGARPGPAGAPRSAARASRTGCSPSSRPTASTWCSPTPLWPRRPTSGPSITSWARRGRDLRGGPAREQYRRRLSWFAGWGALPAAHRRDQPAALDWRSGSTASGSAARWWGNSSDSALLKVFGQEGLGLFAAPTAIAADVRRQYGVKARGRWKACGSRLRRHDRAPPPAPGGGSRSPRRRDSGCSRGRPRAGLAWFSLWFSSSNSIFGTVGPAATLGLMLLLEPLAALPALLDQIPPIAWLYTGFLALVALFLGPGPGRVPSRGPRRGDARGGDLDHDLGRHRAPASTW